MTEDLRVLVVDDNATNLLILKETLLSWGMKPTLVASGREALKSMLSAQRANCPYGLVLLDCHMPDLGGFGVAQEINHHPELRHASIMMLTSGEQSSAVARCKELGIAAYLNKPIGQSELFDTILRVLGSSTIAAETTCEPRKSPAEIAPVPERTLDILVAEDNTINQKLALRLLEKHAHRVVVTDNGIEAIVLWERMTFDLVLMDLQMPGMSGLEATAAIRARELKTGQHIPIIAMTAHAMKGDRERCLVAGMDEYIPKPIHARQLYEVISRLTGPGKETDPASFLQVADFTRTQANESLVDLDTALERLGGDQQLLESVIRMFLEECPSMIANVRTAVLNRDAKSLELAGRMLTGSIAHLGAATACELAFKLELMGKDGNLIETEAITTALETELERVVASVTAFVSEHDEENAALVL